MPLRPFFAAGLLFVSACLPDAPAGPGEPPPPPPLPPGMLLMLRDAPRDSVSFDSALNAVLPTSDSLTIAERWPSLGGAWVLGLTPDEQRQLLDDARVATIGAVEPVTLDGTTGNWALDRLDQRALPLDQRYVNRNGDGTGVRIYVFDTGIRIDHSQFGGRAVAGPDILADPSFASQHATDCHGHGTLAASAAVGRTLGTAPGAQVQSVRVLNCVGQGTSLDIARGADYVLAEYRRAPTRPAVVNMSLGIVGGSSLVDQAVRRLVDAGIPTVVSAGNHNMDACHQSPAREGSAITVGAMTSTDAKASFSNHGRCVDVWAPGVNVLGAHGSTPTMTALWGGTSASAPYVTGLVAAYLSRFPAATPAQVTDALVGRASQVRLGGVPDDGVQRVAFANFGDDTIAVVPPPRAPRTLLDVSCVVRSCSATLRVVGSAPTVFGYDIVTSGALLEPVRITAAPSASADRVVARWRTAATGTFTATAITQVDGVVDTLRRTYTVVNQPPAISAAAATCQGALCVLQGTATDDEGAPSMSWRLANGEVRAGASAEVTLRSGTQSATFTATDALGLQVTRQISFRVSATPPRARLSVRCSGRTCTLDAGASSTTSPVQSYELDAGDGSAPLRGSATTRSVTYRNAGTYRARATVTDRAGQSATATVSVRVR